MHPHLRRVLCASAIHLALLGSSAQVARAQVVTGLVKNSADRTPLAAVVVLLMSDSLEVARDTTRAPGVFFLTAPAPGHYSLLFVSAAGTALADAVPVDLLADETIEREYLVAFTAPAYRDTEVDVPARLLTDPASSWRARISGQSRSRSGGASFEFMADFVVDTMGVPESRSVQIVNATDRGLAQRELNLVMSSYRYEPAIKAGRKVRQIVRWGLRTETTTITITQPSRRSP